MLDIETSLFNLSECSFSINRKRTPSENLKQIFMMDTNYFFLVYLVDLIIVHLFWLHFLSKFSKYGYFLPWSLTLEEKYNHNFQILWGSYISSRSI